MRRGGYLKNSPASAQSATVLPVRQSGRWWWQVHPAGHSCLSPAPSGCIPSGRPLKRCSVSAVMAVVTSLASVPLPLVRRRLKRTPFTTRGVSHLACARYWPSAALTSTVRCCTAGGMTLFREPDWAQAGTVIHDGFFFRYVLHRRDGKGAVRVFPDGDTAEQARRRSDGRESPHTPYVSTPSGRVLTCIRSGAGCAVMSTLTGLPLPLIRFTADVPVSGRVPHGPASGCGGSIMDRTRRRSGSRIVIITDFNNVTGCVPQPLRPEREIHRLRFQQSVFITHSPARWA